jgi:hypothetical protein
MILKCILLGSFSHCSKPTFVYLIDEGAKICKDWLMARGAKCVQSPLNLVEVAKEH